MAKAKLQKGAAGAAQSHLHARISYLYQAATLLQSSATKPNTSNSSASSHVERTGSSNIARQYASQVRATSLKPQLRIPRDAKRSLCKRCDTVLVPGTTCSEEIENKSRGGKKPWADVRVVKCKTCETVKRFPQGKKRSKKLADRGQRDKGMTKMQASET